VTLTAEKLREMMIYLPETGEFHHRKVRKGISDVSRAAGSVLQGHRGKLYIRISVNGKRHLAHRLAWLYSYGEFPIDKEIDHINGDGCDNRLINLRLVDHAQNKYNAKLNLNNVSGIKGVSYSKRHRRWRADIRADGKSYYLGTFSTKEEAARARLDAEVQLHGEFRRQESHGVIP
jgi:hypothetical protein